MVTYSGKPHAPSSSSHGNFTVVYSTCVEPRGLYNVPQRESHQLQYHFGPFFIPIFTETPVNMTVNPTTSNDIHLSSNLNPQNVATVLLERQSHAGFSTRPIPETVLRQLLGAAQLAPSFYNKQPWHFVVIEDGFIRNEINEEFLDWGTDWAVKAPLLIAVVVNLLEGTLHGGLNYAYVDCGISIQNILLQASDMGLAAHPVMFNDRTNVEHVLDLPDESKLLLFIAIGFPTVQNVKTFSQRSRKPLSAIASRDTFHGPPISDIEPTS